MMAMGGMEAIFLILFGGFGLPLGLPPEKEDLVVQRMAPEECLFYMSWAGMAAPDPKSANHTEQLLAEAEVQEFFKSLEKQLNELLEKADDADEFAKLGAEGVRKFGKTVLTRAGGLYLRKIVFKPGAEAPEAFHAGAAINLGDKGAEAKAFLEGLQLKLLSDKPMGIVIDGVPFYQVPFGPPGGKTFPLTWGVRGNYLLATIGDGEMQALFDQVKKGEAAWLKKFKTDLSLPRISSVSYANAAGIVDLIRSAAPPEAAKTIEQLGLDGLGGVASVGGLDEAGYAVRSLIEVKGKARGVLQFIDGKPLSPADIAAIPHDAVLATAFKMDLSAASSQLASLVRTLAPPGERDAEEIIDGLTKAAEMTAGLGDAWQLYTNPREGGMFTGWTISVTLKDAAAVEARMTSEILEKGRLTIKTAAAGDRKISYLNTPSVMTQFAWNFGPDRGGAERLTMGLYPQVVRAAIMPRGNFRSMAERPDVARFFGRGADPLMISVTDSAEMCRTYYAFLQYFGQAMAGMPRFGPGGPERVTALAPTSLPSTGVLVKHIRPMISVARRTPAGVEFYTEQTLPGTDILSSAPIMATMLLPAVNAARNAARRNGDMNSLRQVGLATLNYEAATTRFPPAYSVDKEGKPLLSWRVHLLPYMEEGALYEEFHLDEPWDSEHNKKLIPRMPAVYRSAMTRLPLDSGKSNILAVRGKDCVLAPDGKGRKVAEITDGTTNTVAFVQVDDSHAVEWTKPDDFAFDEMKLAGLGGLHPGGTFLVAFTDVSVRSLRRDIDPKILKAFFTASGGEEVDPFDF